MAIERYEVRDAYTEAELCAIFRDLPVHRRLSMLKRLDKKYRLPFKLRQIAAQEESSLIRAWVARTIWGYSGSDEKVAATEIYEALSQDSDPFVRAACLENEHSPWLGREAMDLFLRLGHTERLALMRNPDLPHDIILALFDLGDERLSFLEETARFQLIFAFLSNEQRRPIRPRPGRKRTNMGVLSDPGELGDKIWERVTKWIEAEHAHSQRLVFKHVDCTAAQRAKAFNALKVRETRAEILRHAGSHEECLQAALDEEDDDLRGYAYAKFSFGFGGYETRQAVVEEVLKGYDLAAMRGLAQNGWFEGPVRDRVLKRAKDLGDQASVAYAAAVERLVKRENKRLAPNKEPSIREVTDAISAIGRQVGKLWTTLVVAVIALAVWRWLR
jgi:hypothetical protein